MTPSVAAPAETTRPVGALPAEVGTLVVGAGFSGVGMAIALEQAGDRDYLVVDRGPEVGGTWRDNTYPGAACDVPSHLYSYSFALNPQWSRAFSRQPEIQRYIRSVTDSHGVRERMRFGVDVTDASWDESARGWVVATDHGTVRAGSLVLGVGALCEPRLPEIEGIESFAGEIFHTARWDHEVPLAGRRVGVIGTGASAIQVVPSIVDEVAHLDVYQRTPPWIVPRMDRAYTGVEKAAFAKVPGFQRLVRRLQWTMREAQVPGLLGHRAGLAPIKAVSRALLAAQVRDRSLREALTPRYEMGCKRILISNTYYPAIAQPKTDLVTSPIRRVTPGAVVTADGTEHPTDVLVVATGFHVTDSPFFDLVHRADGASLGQLWREQGMQAYKGTTVAGFPNLYVLVGPATGLGHSSMIQMIEAQIGYAVQALDHRRSAGAEVLEVLPQVQQAYNDELRRDTAGTVWVAGGCSSWYLDAHGNAPAVWPHGTSSFRAQMRDFDPIAYTTR